MSKDLSVCPKRGRDWYSVRTCSLPFDRIDYDKYDLLEKAATNILDTVYDSDGSEELHEDYYGNPLLEIPIKNFLEIYTIENPTVYDQATLAYLRACPQDDLIMLFYT